MRIANNIMAWNTHRQLTINNNATSKSIEKLSSGLKINRAGDDAAGLSISEKMRAQVRGLTMASKNAQDGISLIQTAEGALNEVHAMLQRMRELAVQSANDTNVSEDRAALQAEMNQLVDAINDVAQRTSFNGMSLLDGGFASKNFHTGANAFQTMNVSISTVVTTATWTPSNALAIPAATKPAVTGSYTSMVNDADGKVMLNNFKTVGTNHGAVSSQANAEHAIFEVDKAVGYISEIRSSLGAIQNRLEYTVRNVENTAENLQAAESRIRDIDMAKEMTNFTKLNILSQAATAMLAQANTAPQGVLQLLR